jgi:hypothetical protein
MRQNILMIVVATALLSAACADNEESFYIEHMKVSPDYPDCEVNTGDPVAARVYVNLFSLEDAPVSAFYLTNALITTENPELLKLESNGIIIEGYELYTTIPGSGPIQGTEYFTRNHLIGPESSDIVFANILSDSTIDAMRAEWQCDGPTPTRLKNVAMYGTTAQKQEAATQYLGWFDGGAPTSVFSVIKFIGRTQGGKKVETQEFSFEIILDCGPYEGWASCFTDPCSTICSAGFGGYNASCVRGLNHPFTCADYISVIGTSVTGNIVETTDGGEMYMPAQNGPDVFDYCSSVCVSN